MTTPKEAESELQEITMPDIVRALHALIYAYTSLADGIANELCGMTIADYTVYCRYRDRARTVRRLCEKVESDLETLPPRGRVTED